MDSVGTAPGTRRGKKKSIHVQGTKQKKKDISRLDRFLTFY